MMIAVIATKVRGYKNRYHVRINGLRVGVICHGNQNRDGTGAYGWYYVPIAGRAIPGAAHATVDACLDAVSDMFSVANRD